jgi:hypothetical protein
MFPHLILKGKWAYQDSNLGPAGYEPVALPLSYRPFDSLYNRYEKSSQFSGLFIKTVDDFIFGKF